MAHPDDKRNAISYTYGDPNADAERARTFLDTINADERAHTHANGGPVTGAHRFDPDLPPALRERYAGDYADAVRAEAHRLAALYPDAFEQPEPRGAVGRLPQPGEPVADWIARVTRDLPSGDGAD